MGKKKSQTDIVERSRHPASSFIDNFFKYGQKNCDLSRNFCCSWEKLEARLNSAGNVTVDSIKH